LFPCSVGWDFLTIRKCTQLW